MTEIVAIGDATISRLTGMKPTLIQNRATADENENTANRAEPATKRSKHITQTLTISYQNGTTPEKTGTLNYNFPY